ncbi:hypothetical protein MCUN1_002635 [Malassezia cuniculi]|uniref:C2H2-type domain-containing protein n=1 Tax=Malassezia cuniculi TaxID=948313 RepID=A0AAF0J715_9BASI|nr:hypothetical protein MCUN1_002635 [Malassezia cuniculi]
MVHADHGGSVACSHPASYGVSSYSTDRVSQGRVPSSFGDRVMLSGSRNNVRPIPSSSRARSSSNAYPPQFATSFGSAGESLNVPTYTHKPETPESQDKMGGVRLSVTMPMGSGMEGAAHHLAMQREMDDGLHRSTSAFDEDIKDGQSNQLLHKCESCAKVYRHPSCLVKHRWEHTMYWKEASKFLMSKHQQVQLLEAAAILVNFDKLMASKMRNQVPFSTEFASYGVSAPAHSMNAMPDSRQNASYRRPGGSSEIDEDEVTMGDESADLDGSPREDNYGYSTGGDMMAEMDMEAE